jgi:hypothetical protein
MTSDQGLQSRRGIQSGEQHIGSEHSSTSETVEQSAFASIRIADKRHHREAEAPPSVSVRLSVSADRVDGSV